MQAELEKLEAYLHYNHYYYNRYIQYDNRGRMIRNELEVYNKSGINQWHAKCQKGSKGFEQGLLEIIGEPVVSEWKDGNLSVGYLTALQVVQRLTEK